MICIAILTPTPGTGFVTELGMQVFEAMAAPLRATGLAVDGRSWTTAQTDDLRRFALVLPLTAWGYHHDLEGFRARLAAWDAAGVRLQNPASVLSWNADKLYLDALARRGAPIPPTVLVERLAAADLVAAAERFGTDELVATPRVSGSAHRTVWIRPGKALDGAPDGPAMIQPYLAAIAEEGELSLYYFDRRFSHAVRKLPRAGDFRVQVQFGGEIRACPPPPDALAAAERVLGAVEEPLLYARVDLVRGVDGGWLLIELELIEPDLNLAYEPGATDRFVRAVRGAAEAGLERL